MKTYTCLTCGKNYKYLVSFKKHQELHRRTFSKANKINRDMKEQLGEEENMVKSNGGSSGEDAKSVDRDSSVHHSLTEDVQSQTTGELDKSESQTANTQKENRHLLK